MRKAKSYFDKSANADSINKKEPDDLPTEKKSRGRICKTSKIDLTLKKRK